MNRARPRIESILRDWQGEDAADHRTPAQIAELIDQEYERYLASLPTNTAAIKAGQEASERHVA